MRTITKIINFVIVNAIFFGFTYMALYSISKYNPDQVRRGIEATINGPGSNFIHQPYSHDFGNITRVKR